MLVNELIEFLEKCDKDAMVKYTEEGTIELTDASRCCDVDIVYEVKESAVGGECTTVFLR